MRPLPQGFITVMGTNKSTERSAPASKVSDSNINSSRVPAHNYRQFKAPALTTGNETCCLYSKGVQSSPALGSCLKLMPCVIVTATSLGA